MNGRYTVDVDIGGTLTDGLFSDGRQVIAVKVDTTPHDFTVCFFDCLRAGAEGLGYADLTAFLAEVAVIRWSSTIATNVLAEGKGPRVGLLISEGHGEDLYGPGVSPAVGKIIAPENIARVAMPLAEEAVLAQVRSLLEHGVRRICVSLKNSFSDPGAEQRIRSLIQEHFPDHFLGAVPVLLGSDVLHHPDDRTRTHMALINAYVHTPLAVALFKAEDEVLLQHKYRRPIYIGHVNGGVARIAKTKGVDTTESGPVFGLQAAATLARQYALDRVLSVDVGGTTTKIGLVLAGQVATAPHGDLFGIPLQTPWVLLRSIALGGGSVARVEAGLLTLGPDSMGAYPGPACYDLGGDNATLTDAFVVIGAMNPDRFLGGRRSLSRQQAERALDEHVARPLGISVAAAAGRVVEHAMALVTAACQDTMQQAGYTAEGFRLFAFGGNGANFAAGVAERLGLPAAYIFGLGPVLSAFGSSVSDICHIHEQWPYATLSPAAVPALRQLLAAGRERVSRDLEGEGMAAQAANLSAELVLAATGDREAEVVRQDLDAALDGGLARLAAERQGTILERMSVRGVSPVPHLELEPAAAAEHAAAASAERRLGWPGSGAAAPVYTWETLRPGATLTGPACLEADTVSCLVLPGWQAQLDGLGNAVLMKGGR